MHLNVRKVSRLAVLRWCARAAVGGGICAGLSGCGHLHKAPADKYVYVTAKQMFLRDRVAAVSNRTGEVTNGEKLVVLEHARHWVRVRTPKGEVGWIEDKPSVIAGQETADAFDALKQAHANDPTVAQATVRDEVVLHSAPGRQTPTFFRLAEGDKLNLLERATVEKGLPGAPGHAAGAPVLKAAAPAAAATRAAATAKTGSATGAPGAASAEAAGPPEPVMEDWWLVRDANGDVGWIYSHLIDVDAPDSLTRYAEGQRMVGAYVLTTVEDPDSGILNNGQTVTSIPEYVTVLGPYKGGLPYDFDQVRVFTWSLKKHQYETAFREKGIAGYLPVTIANKVDPYGKGPAAMTALPTFTYRVLAGGAAIPAPDATTGILTPSATVTKTYRLEGNLCRRILPPGVKAPEEAKVEQPDQAKGKGKKKR